MSQPLEMDRYLILTRDVCYNRPHDLRSRKYEPVSNIIEYLKGTLLHEVLMNASSNHIACIVIDTKELIYCEESDVEVLSEEVMLLLLAISSCKERYEVFLNKERLADGLDMQPGCSVVVRHPQSGEMSGKVRFKGEMRNRVGTYFGVELTAGRNKGNTNGSIGKYRYFECQEDNGLFLALNRVFSKKFDQSRSELTNRNRASNLSSHLFASNMSSTASSTTSSVSNHATVIEPVIGVTDEELARLGIYIGMEVYIFTEVRGRESQEIGTVKFIGRLPRELPTDDIYVGIDLVNPVGNGRGVFNKRHLFKTKPNHAALVPLSGVLPASTCDATPPLRANDTSNRESRQLVNDFTSRKYTEPRTTSSRLPTGRDVDPVLDDQSRFFDSAFTPTQTHLRGPPDGGPIPDFDEDLSSQIDIYGGTDKKYNTFQHTQTLSTSQKQLLRKISIKPSKSFQNLGDAMTLEEGSMVEVIDGIEHLGDMGLVGPVYGVIKWIGEIFEVAHPELMAGIELEIPVPGFTDGTFHDKRYFKCLPDRAFFTSLKNCKRDPRFFVDDEVNYDQLTSQPTTTNFGDFEASGLPGSIAPPTKLADDMIGKGKGIQGHHNSCYLDSTLFSMFAYSYCLDSILYREQNPSDLPQYKDVQQVLKEDIVNPLRRRNFVRADRIMKLREMLDELGSVTGLTNEEKDPEEFLQTLLSHVFKADPLFELRQGDSDHIQECFFYQIFLDKDDKMVLPSTQLLMEQSFLASDLKFREVPVCLILQMPRFGKDYKMYSRVRPSLTLDVTDMVERRPRSCTVCGGLAEYECKQCSIERSMQEHITSYCDQCVKICHQHPMRRKHKYKKIEVCEEYRSFITSEGDVPVKREVLELYAVVCIETSHYVSFAKCGTGRSAKWCFFDSMADRVGEQSGYNIPEVTLCEHFEDWLKMDQSKLLEMERKEMPEHMRRLLCDAYMCLYQSRDMMRYT